MCVCVRFSASSRPLADDDDDDEWQTQWRLLPSGLHLHIAPQVGHITARRVLLVVVVVVVAGRFGEK